MSVSHEDIMAEIQAMKAAMATKADLVPIQTEITALKTGQDQTKELVEVMAFVKTGSRAVAWLSKLTAGLLLAYIFFQGGAEFLVDLGTPDTPLSGEQK